MICFSEFSDESKNARPVWILRAWVCSGERKNNEQNTLTAILKIYILNFGL